MQTNVRCVLSAERVSGPCAGFVVVDDVARLVHWPGGVIVWMSVAFAPGAVGMAHSSRYT